MLDIDFWNRHAAGKAGPDIVTLTFAEITRTDEKHRTALLQQSSCLLGEL